MREGVEFDLIARVAERLGADRPDDAEVPVGIGDDAAVTAPHGVTATSVDTLVEGVHFRRETTPMRSIGHKALASALSDIAAGRVHLVAFNDHTPPILRRLHDPVATAKYSERAGMKLDAFRTLATQVGARIDEVPAALERVAASG